MEKLGLARLRDPVLGRKRQDSADDMSRARSTQGKILNLQITVMETPPDMVQDPFGSTKYWGALLFDLGRLFLVIEKA